MMKIIAVTNQKGGTGKTTSTVNIACGLSALGYRILVIDLDPQANLSHSLGLASPDPIKTIYQVLKHEITLEHAAVQKTSIGIIPANFYLSQAESALSSHINKEYLLKNALGASSGSYDYVLLDCPPSAGLLTLNALVAAQEIFVPVQLEYLALQGMSQLLHIIEEIKGRYNPELTLSGIIATRYDKRRLLNREVIEKLQLYFGDKLYKTFIRENISLAEAPSFGQDIFSYRPESNGARDYMNLCREIVERGEKYESEEKIG